MAPKCKRTAPAPPTSSGRRGGRRPAWLASSSESSSSSSPIPSPTAPSSSNPFSSRQVTTGRKVNFSFLQDEGFEIGNMIKNLGWEKLCSLDLPTYPALVQEFYSTAGRGDRGLIGTVKGKSICVNPSILSNLLDMPTEGMAPQGHSDRAGALSKLLGRDVSEFEEVSANQLSVEMRLLHNIISRILFPKTGRFDFISERDIVMIDCIINGYPLNLPGMMISYMGEACTKKKSSLPYGMVLTLIFRSQGVEIPENEPKKLLRHTDFYNISTLHRMGFRKINGIWEKKASEEPQSREAGQSLHENVTAPASTSETPPVLTEPASTHIPPADRSSVPPAQSGMSEDQFNKLIEIIRKEQSDMKDHLSQQQERFQSEVLSRFKGLEDRMLSLEANQTVFALSLRDDLSGFSQQVKNISEELFKKMQGIADCSEAYSESSAKLQATIDKALIQIEEMFTHFRKTQKEGMGQILERLKRILG